MTCILVVDDDPEVRAGLRLILESAGYQTFEAAEGGEALRLARALAVDLLLLDLFMPGQDGLETLRQWRHEFPRAPVVAISGGAYGGRVDLLPAARRLGAADVLYKPFDRETLLDTLARALAPPA